MSETLTIKVHDVTHSKEDFDKNKVEKHIKQQTSSKVKNVRIARGNSNSPLFLEIDSDINNFNTLKSICRESLHLFSDKVNGIDVQKCVRDDNLKIM